jgi:hypothetical protein
MGRFRLPSAAVPWIRREVEDGLVRLSKAGAERTRSNKKL